MKFNENQQVKIAKAAINLFRVFPENIFNVNLMSDTAKTGRSWFDCFKNGFLVIDQNANPVLEMPVIMFDLIDNAVGSNVIRFNGTFFENCENTVEKTVEERVLHQLCHYFTIYGRELIGLQARPYIPEKDLTEMDLPGIDFSGIKNMVIIQLASEVEMIERVNDLVMTTVSPSNMIKTAFEDLWVYTSCEDSEIKSFELKTILYHNSGKVPSGNLDFLRYVMYLTTGNPMIIKDRNTLDRIKKGRLFCGTEAAEEIITLWKNCNQRKMAEIFKRHKPIFLAYKKFGNGELSPVINRIRRLSDVYHKPLTNDCLQNVVEMILAGKISTAMYIINDASNRDLVKIINFLQNRSDVEATKHVYNIRNGRIYVQEKAPVNTDIYYNLKENIVDILVKRLGKTWENVVFVIPDHVEYPVPTTEKQMSHIYPWGTKIKTSDSDSYSVGIHWTNVVDGNRECRVDLDLHTNGADGTHYGWNGGYGERESDCVYSGDLIDAPLPNGAAEAFWIKPKNQDYIVSVHKYSGPQIVDFKLFACNQKVNRNQRGFAYDPAESFFPAVPFRFDDSLSTGCELTMGLVSDNGFYIYGGSLSRGIIPEGSYVDFIKGLGYKMKNMYSLRDFISRCGGIVVNETPVFDDDNIEERPLVVDLSPEALDVTTLFKIVDGTVIEETKIGK